MSTIVAGIFENILQAEIAAKSLRRHHFADCDVCHFACDPPSVAGGAQAAAWVPQEFDRRLARRRAGVMVAARVNDMAHEQTAIQVLQAEGASQIERAEGEWSGGKWTDFDPFIEPRLVRDRHLGPMTSMSAEYRVGDKRLVGQAQQMGGAGAKGGRSAS